MQQLLIIKGDEIMTNFQFDNETFGKTFPFYIYLDKHLIVKNTGEKLAVLLPDLKNNLVFSDYFVIKNPFVKDLKDFNFLKIINQNIQIEVLEGHFLLQGHFQNYNDGFLFTGTTCKVENHSLKSPQTESILHQDWELDKNNQGLKDALFPFYNPEPIILIDFKGNLISLNPSAQKLKKVTSNGVEYEIEDFLKHLVQKVDSTKKQFRINIKHNKNYYLFFCKVLKDENCIALYGQNVTKQNRNNEELIKHSLLAKNNIKPLIYLYSDGKIFWCNDAYLKLTGFNKDEIIRKTSLEIGLNPASNKVEVKKMLDSFYKGHYFETTVLHSKKDGTTFWAKIVGQPVLDSSGKVLQYFAMIEDITEKQQREEQLSLLSSIADKNMSAVIICDKEGKIEWVNTSFTEMTGYTKEESIGHTPGSLLQGEESNPETITYLRNQIANGLAFNCEIINYSKTKQRYWVRIQGQALRNEFGEVIKFFAIEQNITQEKEFNQQLIDSENRLNLLITNLQSGIFLEDENRKVFIANKQFCKLFDVNAAPETLVGIDCADVAQKNKHFFKNPDYFITRIEEILAKKEVVLAEEIELMDGRIYERSFIPITMGNQQDGHLWSYEDVTIKRRYKESLETEKEKYRNIITNINLGLLEIDTHGLIQLANQSFCDMSGYSLPDLLGHKAADKLLFSEQKNTGILNNEELIGKPNLFETTIVNKEKETKYWLVSGAPNYNINGEIIGSIGIHLDITEQKKLELQKEELLKKLEKQNEQLNDYAQIVSHDLKSPLRSIHSLIGWIKEDNDKQFSPETLQYLDMIEDKTEMMDHLIQGILTYSKVGDSESNREIVNLNNEIQKIIDIIHLPKNIQICIKNNLPEIKAERFRIQQLFQNLISNAVNYIEKPQGFIEIASEEQNDCYIFSVKDNGPGIALEHQEKIFNIFQSFTNKKESTGIGLSIVKKIIENCNGKIWLESELTIGTTFFIKLPKLQP